MGQGQSVFGDNDLIEYAVAYRKGSRQSMEDAYTATLDLDGDGSGSTACFAVYDGHGGADVALYCAKRFHTELINEEHYEYDLGEAMNRVFPRIDEQIGEGDEWRALANPPRFSCMLPCFPSPAPCVKLEVGEVGPSLLSWRPNAPKFSLVMHLGCYHTAKIKGTPYTEGSTACVALIRGNQIIVGNVGDSRCVISRKLKPLVLSTNHTLHNKEECIRIGYSGRVAVGPSGAYHVDGILPLTRAIGDFQHKPPLSEPIVICTPAIRIVPITYDTDFLIIASHPLWKSYTDETVVSCVNQHLGGETSLDSICSKLMSGRTNLEDDVTIILVKFKVTARLPPPPVSAPATVGWPNRTDAARGNAAVCSRTASTVSSNAGAEGKSGTSMTGGAPQPKMKEE